MEEPLSDPEGLRQLETRTYVFNRLGDVGTPDLIPAIERFIQRRREANDWATRSDIVLAQLTIERIQARAKGPEAYKNTMLNWIRNTASYADSVDANGRFNAMAVVRFGYGVRALAVIGAGDTVPLILDAIQEADKKMPRMSWFFNRPHVIHWLAQLEDAKLLEELRKGFFSYGTTTPFSTYYLEPGEKDPIWLYWQIRTRGMDVAQTVRVMLEAAGGEGPRRMISRVIVCVGETAVPPLVKYIVAPPVCSDPESAQAVAISAIGEIGSNSAVTVLCRMLATGSPRLKAAAAYALGKIGDPVALPDLLELAQSNDFYVQMSAIRALGNLGDSRAEPVLLKLLSEHPKDNIRYAAVEALMKVGTPAAIPVLEGRLQAERSRSVQGRINWALRILRQKAR